MIETAVEFEGNEKAGAFKSRLLDASEEHVHVSVVIGADAVNRLG